MKDIASPDEDGETDPVPVSGGGMKPEPEIDVLSNIVRAFNEKFGSIDWKDADKIRQVITEELPERVAVRSGGREFEFSRARDENAPLLLK